MEHKIRPLPIFKSRFGRTLSALQQWVMLICGILVVLMMFTYVFMRYVLKLDFPGFEELIRIIMFWLYFIGGVNGSYERSHISADMMDSFVKSEKAKTIIRLIVSFLGLVVLTALFVLSIQYVAFNISMHAKTTTYKLPLACTQMALCVGYGMMLYYDVIHFVADIIEVVRGRRFSDESESGEIQ